MKKGPSFRFEKMEWHADNCPEATAPPVRSVSTSLQGWTQPGLSILRTEVGDQEDQHKKEKRNTMLVNSPCVGSTQAHCLIDCGATHKFMSFSWAEKAYIALVESEEEFWVRLADGCDRVTNDVETESLNREVLQT